MHNTTAKFDFTRVHTHGIEVGFYYWGRLFPHPMPDRAVAFHHPPNFVKRYQFAVYRAVCFPLPTRNAYTATSSLTSGWASGVLSGSGCDPTFRRALIRWLLFALGIGSSLLWGLAPLCFGKFEVRVQHHMPQAHASLSRDIVFFISGGPPVRVPCLRACECGRLLLLAAGIHG